MLGARNHLSGSGKVYSSSGHVSILLMMRRTSKSIYQRTFYCVVFAFYSEEMKEISLLEETKRNGQYMS